jgi:hypothetical protein
MPRRATRFSRIGGGGNETWMVVVPVVVGLFIVTTVMGGPMNTLNAVERLAYDAIDAVSLMLRR